MTPQPSEQPDLHEVVHRYDVHDGGKAVVKWACDKCAARFAAPDPVASPLSVRLADTALRRALPADMVYAYRPTGDPFTPWARKFVAEYERARLEGQPVADPGALGDQIVEEGRVSAWGPPGTTFTPERQAKGQPVAEEPA